MRVMRTIHLYGRLRRKYGESFKVSCGSVRDAIMMINANFPGFTQEFKRGHYQICKGKVRATSDKDLKVTNVLNEKEVDMGFGDGDYHIAPMAVGAGSSGKGWAQVIVGVVLIAASIYFAGPLGAYATPMMMAGASLTLNGVATLLMTTPDKSVVESDRPEDNKSFHFSGTLNVATEGGAIGVTYGRDRVGSTVIGMSIAAEEL